MNLEKEFVPYEPSLALKELGFDEPCFKKYIVGCLWSSPTTPELYKHIHSNSSDCLAPLYQQAFRWFREKHKLGAIVSQFGYGIEDEYGQIIYNIDDDEKPLCYEEAELACLIKLIEIVKEKKNG